MAKTREIKTRIRAVTNIQRITKTMQMIATARFQSALKRATATQPYARHIAALVGKLASRVGDVEHPLLRQVTDANRTNRELVLVVASNRGLCGAYNANVLRAAMQHFKSHPDTTFDVEVVGRKAISFFKFSEVPVSQVHAHIGETAKYEDVEALAEDYMKRFADGDYDAVRVVYMAYESASRQNPEVAQLLPLDSPTESGEASAGPTTVYDFSPDAETLLSELLPITVKTRLFQAFNEAEVSEHIARMVAMKAATDAAGKMGKQLKRDFNRARQAAITTELSEIIGGSAGLE